MTILPIPQQIEQHTGEMPLAVLQNASLNAPAVSLDGLKRHLNELCSEAGARCRVTANPSGSYMLSAGVVQMDVKSPSGNPLAMQQGYRLHIDPKGLTILAWSEKGLFYGLMTLRQILLEAKRERRNSLQAVDIFDWPALSMRGYHEDYGRDQLPTMADHRFMIRCLAQYKMDTFMFYIEPDHFVYKFDPNISPTYDRFTIPEIRELVAYARRYHVQIIPVVELLGHCEMLLSNPQYRHIGEMPNGGGDLCPTSEEAWKVVANIIDELAPAFGATYFHTGLDESFAVGQGRSADAVKKHGIAKVFADWYNRLNRHIRKHGQIMMMYGDIVMTHPDILSMLDKDIVLMSWDYIPRDRYESLDRFTKLGFETTGLSGLWDWSQAYPCYGAGFRNIDDYTRQCVEVKSMGHLVSSWGDNFRGVWGLNLSELNDSGVVYCGCSGWTGKPIPIRQYYPMFCESYYGSSDPKLVDALLSLALAQGEGLEHLSQAANMMRGDLFSTIFTMLDGDDTTMAYWRTLGATADKALLNLNRLRLPRNGDRMDAVIIGARQLQIASRMAEGAYAIAKSMNQPKLDAVMVEGVLSRLIAEQRSLAKAYKTVWLRRNRPLHLKHIEPCWDFTIGRLENVLSELRAGKLSYSTRKALLAQWQFDQKAPWESKPKGITFKPSSTDASIRQLSDGTGYVHLQNNCLVTAIDDKQRLDFGRNAFTVELWTRQKGQKPLQYGSTILSYGNGWRIGVMNGHLTFTLYTVFDQECPSAMLPVDGEWHHMAVSFNNCHKVCYFIDGQLKAQMELAGLPNSTKNPQIVLGNDPASVSAYEGDITRLRIHAGALTADQLDTAFKPARE